MSTALPVAAVGQGVAKSGLTVPAVVWTIPLSSPAAVAAGLAGLADLAAVAGQAEVGDGD